ncbi:hypothetical protein JQC81_11470 [Microvirga arabica]|nr:hypothetical protein [Microvirga arabica]MBM1171574.1 hypothetical protein [Microvirga arabica]
MDPKVQELAEAVIKAQEGEIAMMRQSNGMACAKADFVGELNSCTQLM